MLQRFGFAGYWPRSAVRQSPLGIAKKKAAQMAPLFEGNREIRSGGVSRLLHRAGILALGIDVAIDELDHRHRGVVAVAEAGLDDSGVTAVTVRITLRQHVEQLLDLIDIADFGDGLAAHGEPALLAERHELFDDRAKFLGLGQRGDDLLVLDQRGRHVGEHRAAMLGGAVELAVNLAVTHETNSFFFGVATVRPTLLRWA